MKFPGPGKSSEMSLIRESPENLSARSWKVLELCLLNFQDLESPGNLSARSWQVLEFARQ